MSPRNRNLAVEIVRFVKEDFPGWVECEFADVAGRRHTFVDKVPMFSLEALGATSTYPQSGFARCELLNQWQDEGGRELAQISTASPDGIESTEGLTEFVVLSSQLDA